MTATPLPADVIPIAPPAGPGGAGVPATTPGEAPNAAEFAALLREAGTAEAAAADERSLPAAETAADGPPAEAAAGSAFDGLLFLAALNPAPVASVLPAPLLPRSGIAGSTESGALPDASHLAGEAVAATAQGAQAGVPGGPDARGGKGAGAQFLAASTQAAKRDDRQSSTGAASIADAASPTGDPVQATLQTVFLSATSVEGARAKPGPASLEMQPGAAQAGTEPALAGTSATTQLRPPVTIPIDTPVHDPSWRADAMGKIASLVTRGGDHAELRLSPADLGPVEVRIDVRGGEMTLAIVATQATTRDALEQALPLLREMLMQQGLSLGEASVQDGRADGGSSRDEAAPRAGTATRFAAPAAETPVSVHAAPIRRLVDVFV